MAPKTPVGAQSAGAPPSNGNDEKTAATTTTPSSSSVTDHLAQVSEPNRPASPRGGLGGIRPVCSFSPVSCPARPSLTSRPCRVAV